MTESFQPADTPEAKANTGKNFRDELVAKYLCATTPGSEEKALNALRQDEFRLAMAGMTPEQRRFWTSVDQVPWDKVKEGGKAAAEVFLPALIGFQSAEYLSPEAGQKLAAAAIIGSAGMEALALGVYKAEKVAERHPRAAALARGLTWSRILLSHGGTVLGSFGLGLGGAEIRDAIGRLHGIGQIVSPAAAGGGEGFNNPHPGHRPVDASIGQVGGLPPEDRGVGAVIQPSAEPPPTLSPAASEFVNRAGEVAAQEAREMADAAQGAAEMAARQAVLDAATKIVEVQPGNTLTGLIDAAGGDAYGVDFTNTVLQSANVLTGPQNPNRDMATALIDFIKAHPGGVNWRDAINGVGDLAKQTVGGLPLKDAIAQATRMIYPGQEIKVVVGAAMP